MSAYPQLAVISLSIENVTHLNNAERSSVQSIDGIDPIRQHKYHHLIAT